ncbi:hypothetical protein CHUAL_000861 [Chamberlinius hualienensis]
MAFVLMKLSNVLRLSNRKESEIFERPFMNIFLRQASTKWRRNMRSQRCANRIFIWLLKQDLKFGGWTICHQVASSVSRKMRVARAQYQSASLSKIKESEKDETWRGKEVGGGGGATCEVRSRPPMRREQETANQESAFL